MNNNCFPLHEGQENGKKKSDREWYIMFNLYIQTCCLVWLLVFTLILVATGMSIGKTVNVYLDSADITPSRFSDVVNKTFDIISNVDEISTNVVPISSEAKKSIVNGTSNTVVGDALSNTYKSFAEVGAGDWKNLITNVTRVFASVATINHTAVTSLIGDLHSSDMQAAIRERVDKVLETVDTTGHSVYDIYKTMRLALSYNASKASS